MTTSNQVSSQHAWPARRCLTCRRVAAIGAIYLFVGCIPPSPFERPMQLFRLSTAPAPDHVVVPVENTAARALRDSWGNPRGNGRRHEGIDLFAPRGARVVASTEGIVWRIAVDPLGGNVVWLFGPAGQMHYYAHLERYGPIAVGDRVAAGALLGTVGTTGNARGGPPHLHYGVYAHGRAINPFPLLAAQPSPPAR